MEAFIFSLRAWLGQPRGEGWIGRREGSAPRGTLVELGAMRKLGLIFLLGLVSVPGFAGKHDDIGPTCNLSFVILKDYNGKPVRNAAVVLHLVNDKGKQERGGIELKTDAEGKANYETIPYGKLRVQVLMTGFQTYGTDYDINQVTMEITIRIKRPEEQYSTYGPDGEEKKPEEKK
jgi:hypothetical protein